MKSCNKVVTLLLTGILYLLGSAVLWSQDTKPVNETNEPIQVPSGLTISDLDAELRTSALTDTLKIPAVGIDSLSYMADSIYYHYATEQIFLYGNTSVKYQTSTILADSLQIDLKQERAFSTGRTVLIDNDQVLIGNQVYYDVNSQTGMMYDTASKLEKGYYYGDE
ncbi:MAG: hypothetical protein R6V77_05620, partial [Candidatus Cloacimonadaceae bacterium]